MLHLLSLRLSLLSLDFVGVIGGVRNDAVDELRIVGGSSPAVH